MAAEASADVWRQLQGAYREQLAIGADLTQIIEGPETEPEPEEEGYGGTDI